MEAHFVQLEIEGFHVNNTQNLGLHASQINYIFLSTELPETVRGGNYISHKQWFDFLMATRSSKLACPLESPKCWPRGKVHATFNEGGGYKYGLKHMFKAANARADTLYSKQNELWRLDSGTGQSDLHQEGQMPGQTSKGWEEIPSSTSVWQHPAIKRCFLQI